MATKKVVRKQKTIPISRSAIRSAKYMKSQKNEEFIKESTGSDYRDIAVFANDLLLAYNEAKNEWEKASPENKKEMMFEYIRAHGKDTAESNKLRRTFFTKGTPNFRAFEKEVFENKYFRGNEDALKRRNIVGLLKSDNKKEKILRSFINKRLDIRDSDTYTFLSGDSPLKKTVQKKILAIDNVDSNIIKEEERKIRQKGVRDKLKKKGLEAELGLAVKTGSLEEKIDTAINNPDKILSHLKSRVAGKTLSADKASEYYTDLTGERVKSSVFKELRMEMPQERLDLEKAIRVSAALNFKKPEDALKQTATRAVTGYIKNDPELNAMPIDKAIKALDGKSIRWSEVVAYNQGKTPSMGPIINKLSALGITVTEIPEGKGYLKKKKKKGIAGTMYTGSKTKYTPSGRKASSAGLLGGKTYSMTQKGEVRVKKEKGKIGKTLGRIKDKTWSRVRPTPKERVRDFAKKYEGYIDDDLLEEDKVLMGKSTGVGGWLQRRLKEREARRFATDPDYRSKVQEKRRLEEGIRTAKILKAQREAKARTRAATSPWYGAFYHFSKYSKWIALTALIVAIVFIPIGMFHVLGWALAVGVIALFQFIIWVFMEIWLLLAQAIVAIVGLVGQAFIMAVNWVGRALGDSLGYEYEPFQHQTVQNMLLFERHPETGNWVVYTYTDTAGLTQAQIDAGMAKQEILTWGALNLAPPSFLNLDLFRPTVFDTDTIIAKILPPISDFFRWMYEPIAQRYTAWMADPLTEWYWPGVIIGIPAVLIIVGIIILWRFTKRKYQLV